MSDSGASIEKNELIQNGNHSGHKIEEKVSESPPIAYTRRSTRSTTRASPILSDEDPQDEAVSMMLSQIDKESYETALVYDTERILQRHVLPKSFLWNKPRIQLLRSLPRDIEDMPGILHAGTVSPFQIPSTNNGPLGFGMFDMGGLRKIDVKDARSHTIPSTAHPNGPPPKSTLNSEDDSDSSEYPLKSYVNYRAAARRSDDPGIIELRVHLPPLPLETALLTCQQHNILPRDPWLKHDKTSLNRAKMLVTAERMDTLATMPFRWGDVEKDSQQYYLSDSDDPHTYEACLDSVGMMPTDKEELYNAIKRREMRKLRHAKKIQSSFRKWRLSVRVGGVSSRKVLIKEDEARNCTPMHLIAAFPNYFQVGKSVSIDMAQKLDEESTCDLGSYDCRAYAPNASMSYQAMKSTKKDSRAKKNINIGRTRPIWSNFHQAGNNKIVCTSDLTGEKLVSDAAKRPLQAAVFVRLNDEIISISKENKRLNNYPEKANFQQKIKWNQEDIVEGINEATKNACIEITAIPLVPNKNSICDLDPEEYLHEIADVLKPPIAGKKRKVNESVNGFRSAILPMKYGATDILKYIPPRFNCLPLEDGYLRVVCERNGSLQPCDVHDVLKSVAEEDNLCTVSFSTDDKKYLLTCVACGLKVDVRCCVDKGKYMAEGSWTCSICIAAPSINVPESPSTTSTSSVEIQLPSRKSRRTPRLPTRFTENAQVDHSVIRSKSNMSAIHDAPRRPSPRCNLCPHSGGAMSQLDGPNSTHWTHDLCSIYCSKKKNDSMNDCHISQSTVTPSKSSHSDDELDKFMKKGSTSNPSIICTICGLYDDSNNDEDRQCLMKCAAQGCNIMFHPMCATLVTKLRDPNTKNEQVPSSQANDEQIQMDIELCKDFTLDFIEVSYEIIQEDKKVKHGDSLFIVRGNNMNSKTNMRNEKRSVIPVGFCPLHNPKRSKSFYGCTPGAGLISDFMNVPYQK